MAEIELYSCGWASTFRARGQESQSFPALGFSVVSAILKKNAQVMFANLAAETVVVLTVHAQGPAEPQQDVSILYSSRSTVVEGCTVLIIAVPHYRFDDNFIAQRSLVALSSRLVLMPS